MGELPTRPDGRSISDFFLLSRKSRRRTYFEVISVTTPLNPRQVIVSPLLIWRWSIRSVPENSEPNISFAANPKVTRHTLMSERKGFVSTPAVPSAVRPNAYDNRQQARKNWLKKTLANSDFSITLSVAAGRFLHGFMNRTRPQRENNIFTSTSRLGVAAKSCSASRKQ